jgi:hypothetical protein
MAACQERERNFPELGMTGEALSRCVVLNPIGDSGRWRSGVVDGHWQVHRKIGLRAGSKFKGRALLPLAAGQGGVRISAPRMWMSASLLAAKWTGAFL